MRDRNNIRVPEMQRIAEKFTNLQSHLYTQLNLSHSGQMAAFIFHLNSY